MALNKHDPDFMAYKASKSLAERRRLADKLVRANVALIHKLVHKYSRHVPAGIEQDDLFQAGCIAFLRTLDKSDPRRPFSTLCAYWIRYEIGRCVDKSRSVLRPRLCNIPYAILKKADDFQTQHGRIPTAAEMGVTQYKWDRWREAQGAQGVSLDENQTEDKNLHAVLASEDITPDEALEHAELLEAVQRLPAEERRVVELVFLKDTPSVRAAELMRMSVDRVRDIKYRALEELRDVLGDCE